MKQHQTLSLAALSLLLMGAAGCARLQTVSVASLEGTHEATSGVVTGARDPEFVPLEDATIPLRVAQGWLRITSRVSLDAASSPQLVLSDVFLLKLDAWRAGGVSAGSYVTYGNESDGRSSSRGLAIALPGGIAEGAVLYLKIDARGIAPIRVSIETLAQAQHNDRRHTQVRSMLLSAMAVTCILALAFGIGLGERSHLYFGIMLLCQMAHFAVIGGELRFVLAGAEALERNLQAGRFVGSLGTVASIEFMRLYLELSDRQPLASRALLLLGGVLGFNALASLVTAASWTAQLGNFGLLCTVVMLLAATLRGCAAGQRASWFVLVSCTPPLVFSALRICEALGWFSGPPWLSYLFPASFVYASLMLMLGLTERMLKIQRERQEAMLESQRRGRQLATASHDIRQPLLALRATFTRLTDTGDLTPAVFERFRGSLEYLDKLAAEYTASADTGSGHAAAFGDTYSTRRGERPPTESLAVALLLHNIALMYRDEAEAKGLEFRLRSSTATVTANAMATMRIISNLVANAVKYTQCGRILVGCRRRHDCIAIVVADTGPGIASEDLERVFQEGERGSAAHETEGSGLGLSIAMRLAAQCGLGLRVASVLGRGTAFSVELPLAARG